MLIHCPFHFINSLGRIAPNIPDLIHFKSFSGVMKLLSISIAIYSSIFHIPHRYHHRQAAAGKVKSHFSQRQRGAAAVPSAAPHSARCWAMPWRFKRSVRWQLGQKKAMARWSETWARMARNSGNRMSWLNQLNLHVFFPAEISLL